ncbi:hypothetical protein BJY04DRAFT_199384 [Aspergillus karnatakaensis]|uniref:uncharacterized protein n=1 Tax=Aspergillus karnatakaensis TaxID=1810916 RepID=UPI003CCCC467
MLSPADMAWHGRNFPFGAKSEINVPYQSMLQHPRGYKRLRRHGSTAHYRLHNQLISQPLSLYTLQNALRRYPEQVKAFQAFSHPPGFSQEAISVDFVTTHEFVRSFLPLGLEPVSKPVGSNASPREKANYAASSDVPWSPFKPLRTRSKANSS